MRRTLTSLIVFLSVTSGAIVVSPAIATNLPTSAAPVYLGKLNLNTATEDQLMKVKGIGKQRAAAIIRYRQQHGIGSLQDLTALRGINQTTIKRWQHTSQDKK